MTAITVAYRVVPGDTTARPLIRLRFHLGPVTIPVIAIVDSGADRSAVPLGLASSIGLTYDPAKRVVANSAGGVYEQYEATNTVTVQSEVGDIVLDHPSLNAHLPLVLLGRNDFFMQYRVTFDQRGMCMRVESHAATTPAKKKKK